MLEDEIVAEKQVIVMSLLKTVVDDFRALHSQLDKIQITEKIDQMYLLDLLKKQGNHQQVLCEVGDHLQAAKKALKDIH